MKMDNEAENKTPTYMELPQLKFALGLPEYKNDVEMTNQLLKGIIENDMAAYYCTVCSALGWVLDNNLLNRMSTANNVKLEQLGIQITKDVVTEEEDAPMLWKEKLDYLCSIGDKEAALQLGKEKLEIKFLSTNARLDLVFTMYRVAFFHGCDVIAMKDAVEKATELVSDKNGSGGDWTARNKLKAYDAIYSMAIRDYARAAKLLLDVVPTFESYELVPFGTVIMYSVLASMIALPRCEIKKEVMEHGVIQQALISEYSDLKEYICSLYEGRYADFFLSLAGMETLMKRDPLLHRHYHHYVREMRLLAYSQLLKAYRSLTLKSMAETFGVTTEYMEKEVAHFAAAGRLQCKIDRVAGTVVTNNYTNFMNTNENSLKYDLVASYDRGFLYQNNIKLGDNLLNRVWKLARVMDF